MDVHRPKNGMYMLDDPVSCEKFRCRDCQVILDRAREALRMVTTGKFNDALNAFRSVLQAIPISVANDANEERQLTEMIDTCREYVNFTRLQV